MYLVKAYWSYTKVVVTADFYHALLWLILNISLYFLYNIIILHGIGWLVGGSFLGETFLATDVTA